MRKKMIKLSKGRLILYFLRKKEDDALGEDLKIKLLR